MFKKIGNIFTFNSSEYNTIFNSDTGLFLRWGNTYDVNPNYSPFPEILDMEVTTICSGPGGKLCKFCYKSNTPNGRYMNIDTFKNIMSKFPIEGPRQIAFGVDAQCKSNPDIWKIIEHTRSLDIVPNITIADISDETADNLVKYCGAVAVSRYENKNYCYDSIYKLISRGLRQVNIHICVCKETLPQIYETINDYINKESRIEKLHAIVLLSLKQKGRGINYTPLSQDEFNKLSEFIMENNIPCGFDSCTAHKFLKSIKHRHDYEKLETFVEPCESSCFSAYINVDGMFYPCSFTEGEKNWKTGLNVNKCNNFIHDIWNNEKTLKFRNCLLENGRNCPIFEI